MTYHPRPVIVSVEQCMMLKRCTQNAIFDFVTHGRYVNLLKLIGYACGLLSLCIALFKFHHNKLVVVGKFEIVISNVDINWCFFISCHSIYEYILST